MKIPRAVFSKPQAIHPESADFSAYSHNTENSLRTGATMDEVVPVAGATTTPLSADAGPLLVVSCEHGGNRIPARYRPLFHGWQPVLDSHRGYDAGALALAREMATRLGAPLQAATVSRLLIDLNRSPGHPRLYSAATRALAPAQRREIFDAYYRPYRDALQRCIVAAIAGGRRVVHVSCHSFTPELDGDPRDADIGLLYDPTRAAEVALCRRWQAQLAARLPALRIRRNYPYRGRADGFATYLRRCFAPADYAGIELEVSQAQVARRRAWPLLRQALVTTLDAALAEQAQAAR